MDGKRGKHGRILSPIIFFKQMIKPQKSGQSEIQIVNDFFFYKLLDFLIMLFVITSDNMIGLRSIRKQLHT